MRLFKMAAVLMVTFCVLLIFAKNYLIVSQEPRQSDVIIVLSGGPGRMEKAAELYLQGYAEYVMLSNSNEGGFQLEDALQYGIPESAIILETKATSTYSTAVHTLEKMNYFHFQSAIVVSSDYHMRRSKVSFNRVYRQSGIELIYVAGKTDFGDTWYPKCKEISAIFSEWYRLIGYYLKLYEYIDLP
ncbi:YdcF family protein [Caldibacillus lycopersici]|uniref:YdcF family protein n=1 Tax=Perspicuibacillus lycopersici TaxID=1325689 RepID=A0AAE3LM39_9BACI|nr:YdcF family protein [Perspicuibacillus lycopersici]MCU9612312.1 YdcF family protein [Perspicuibacillus lycopersici]